MARSLLLALGATLALGACTSIWAVEEEPRAAPPPPVAAQQEPAPFIVPPPPAPNVAAPGVSAPPAPRPPPPSDPNTVVVPGVVERQVPAPEGDPRTTAERMADIRAWDQCVLRVQSRSETDPGRPQLDTPEELCAQSLGMAEREAVPISREP